jgi:ATP-dependent Clp protease protease subunit
VQDITIFDQIGQYYGYNKKYLKYELDAAQGGDVRVLISSDGGDVTEGVALGSMLEMYPGKVETLGVGLVASIATVPLMSGDVVKMTKNSFLMIHSPWGGAIGTANEMRNTADTLEKMDDMLIDFYVDSIRKRKKAGVDTPMRVKEMMAAETWLTAQQAHDLGFIDEIIQGGQYENQINAIPMQNRLSQYRHTPAALINKN